MMNLRDWIRRRCSVLAIPGELIAERGGRQVAVLSDPQLEDMFWFRWRITPVVEDATVTSEEFWNVSEFENTVFRCKQSNAIADTAFWAVSDPVRSGRLVLRGAYAPFEISFRRQPFLWLMVLLFGGDAYERPTVADEDDGDASGHPART